MAQEPTGIPIRDLAEFWSIRYGFKAKTLTEMGFTNCFYVELSTFATFIETNANAQAFRMPHVQLGD